MKNTYIYSLLLVLVFSITTFGQEKTWLIEYRAISNSGAVGTGNILIFNKNNSLYGKLKSNNKDNDRKDERIDNNLYIRTNKKSLVYKDLEKNLMISNEKIFLDNYEVQDVNNIFNWKLTEEKKEILGRICKKAIVDFRGRTYAAYYDESLKYPFGPWKFSGLPGVILEIKSEDNFIKYEASYIKTSEDTIDNPFKNSSDLIPFQKYKEMYIEKYKENTAERKVGDRTVKSEMSKGGKEIYIDF
ncbi:GLPGLI family protein [Chryseobacterium chendengshani]|uniref:GLPGLI family protein n=1 Tax=Chryseobacterium sp. LJ668 TaxID=2864040 RepID=UPI001C690DF0|nr:GLPGLI family protein [Chryseobacterium sp. LJ668]MBW8523795.1 GLPGLI family protein [Chryseobacterium sp. LJ668]QYK16738.1 GLPGLI family protein [Chryseobacterium sp. LJ668]